MKCLGSAANMRLGNGVESRKRLFGCCGGEAKMFCFFIRKLFLNVFSQNSVVGIAGLYCEQQRSRVEICRPRT